MNHRTARGVRRGLVALALVFSGCSILPRFGPAPSVGPPGELAGSGTSMADTLTAGPEERPEGTPKRGKSAAPREGVTRPSTSIPGGASAESTGASATGGATAAPAETTKGALDPSRGMMEPRDTANDSMPAARTLSIDLPEEERARLETQTLQDIEAAQQLAGEAKVRNLTAAEEEKLLTVLGLIDQAESAREGKDLSAASNLARKARLLAAELVPK